MGPRAGSRGATWRAPLIALPSGHALPASLGHASGGGVAALLVLGLVLSTVPFLLWAWVLARLPASVAAPALLMIGPAGVLMGWMLLGEQPAGLALVGGAVTLAGVAAGVVPGALRLRARLGPLGRAPPPPQALQHPPPSPPRPPH